MFFDSDFRRSGLQGLLGTRRSRGEEETASDTNDIHVGPAERVGARVSGDALPGHLHQGRDRHEDRPDGGQSAGQCIIHVERLASIRESPR